MKALSFFVLALTSCGSGSDSSSSESENSLSWPIAEKSAFLDSCIEEAQNAGAKTAGASGYCLCVEEALMKKYSYEEYQISGYTILKEIQSDGTVQRCVNENRAMM